MSQNNLNNRRLHEPVGLVESLVEKLSNPTLGDIRCTVDWFTEEKRPAVPLRLHGECTVNLPSVPSLSSLGDYRGFFVVDRRSLLWEKAKNSSDMDQLRGTEATIYIWGIASWKAQAAADASSKWILVKVTVRLEEYGSGYCLIEKVVDITVTHVGVEDILTQVPGLNVSGFRAQLSQWLDAPLKSAEEQFAELVRAKAKLTLLNRSVRVLAVSTPARGRSAIDAVPLHARQYLGVSCSGYGIEINFSKPKQAAREVLVQLSVCGCEAIGFYGPETVQTEREVRKLLKNSNHIALLPAVGITLPM